MAKIIDFDNSNEYRLKKAEETFNAGYGEDALSLLFDVLERDKNDVDAKLMIARIYATLNQHDKSTEYYLSVLAEKKVDEAVKGIVANLLCQGHFKDARYYSDKYDFDLDFSDFLTVETENGDVIYGGDDDEDEAEKRRSEMHLVVSKKTKDGKNLIDDKKLNDLTVGDLGAFSEGSEFINFSELMEKLINLDEVADDVKEKHERRTKVGFKQVYPPTNGDCEEIISKAYNTLSEGKPEAAVALLDTISEKSGKWYYQAQKNKVMCYLSMNRLVLMKEAAETALKGLPDDFTLNCYYYMALRLLEEDTDSDTLLAKINKMTPHGVVEYMVKLDVCRLSLDHKGIIECADKVLTDFPYQPQFLSIKAKAQYNVGNIKAARASLLKIVKMFPDDFEAKTLLQKIDAKEDGLMSYGEIELAIRRVKLMGEISMLFSDSRAVTRYLTENKNAISNLEFLLTNESDRNVYSLITNLRYYIPGGVEELFKKILLKINASEYLKRTILTYYLFGSEPSKVAVTVGRRLVTVEMPVFDWQKGLPDQMVLAANMAFADFILGRKTPEKYVTALATRLVRIGEYLWSATSDRETVRNLLDVKDVLALKRAFTDLTLHNTVKKQAMTVQDELYLCCVDALNAIEDEYEI